MTTYTIGESALKEYIIITAKGCPSCEALKKVIPQGKGFTFMDVTESLEAAQIVKDLGINAVPVIVSFDKESAKMCLLDDKLTPEKCVTKTA